MPHISEMMPLAYLHEIKNKTSILVWNKVRCKRVPQGKQSVIRVEEKFERSNASKRREKKLTSHATLQIRLRPLFSYQFTLLQTIGHFSYKYSTNNLCLKTINVKYSINPYKCVYSSITNVLLIPGVFSE
jgi:hypothetical protein